MSNGPDNICTLNCPYDLPAGHRVKDHPTMSNQTARERMTREQLKLQRFTAYDDTEKEEREVVPLVDALAYGADERAAGVAEGLMIATKAMCGFCSNQYGRADDDQPVVPVKDKFGTWVHDDGKGWMCDAGPIHDAIARAGQGETEC